MINHCSFLSNISTWKLNMKQCFMRLTLAFKAVNKKTLKTEIKMECSWSDWIGILICVHPSTIQDQCPVSPLPFVWWNRRVELKNFNLPVSSSSREYAEKFHYTAAECRGEDWKLSTCVCEAAVCALQQTSSQLVNTV